MIDRVVIFNRRDCCSERLNPFNIHIGDSDQVSTNPKCGGDHRIALNQPMINVQCQGMKGRYVAVRLPVSSRVLTLCEVQVFIELCGLSAFCRVPQTDCSPGDDIASHLGVTLQWCVDACCADSTCLSFQYNTQSECYLKQQRCSAEEKVSAATGTMYDRINLPACEHVRTTIAASDSYQWDLELPRSSHLTFRVQASNDVSIALSVGISQLADMYEILIGGWYNTGSAIRRRIAGVATQTHVSTPGTCQGPSAFHHFPQTDCGTAVDIASHHGVTLQFCAEACCADLACLSFQYNTDNSCYLKNKICSAGQKTTVTVGNMYDRLVAPASKKWRADGRCGQSYPAADGNPGECDPGSNVPCCSPVSWCGRTAAHCSCQSCIDYRDTACLSCSWLTRDSSWVVGSAGTPWVNNGLTYDAAKVLDGDPGTYWNPRVINYTHNIWYIVLDLTAPHTLTSIAVNNYGDNIHDIANFALEKSHSGDTYSWENVVSVTTVQAGTDQRQEFGGFKGTARYWRFVVTQTHSGYQPWLRELNLYGIKDILSADELRGFWISWAPDGTLAVGREGEGSPFMQWRDPDPLPFQYLGYSTGYGIPGLFSFPCQSCPDEYVYHQPSRFCYKAFNDIATYNDAVSICSLDGGTLAMPRDTATNDFLSDLKNAVDNNAKFRFGLTDVHQEGVWMWNDNVPLGDFRAWGTGEPNNDGNEDCAEYESSSNTWNDGKCTWADRKFICQVSPPVNLTESNPAQCIPEMDVPQFLACAGATLSSVGVSWIRPQMPLFGYRLMNYNDGNAAAVTRDLEAESQSYVLQDVQADREHHVILVAVGEYSESLPVSVTCATMTPPPEDLGVPTMTGTSAKASWTPTPSPIAIGYRVWIRERESAGALFTHYPPISQTEVTFKDLIPATEYIISATTINMYIEGPEVYVTAATDTEPPSELYVEDWTIDTVVISWLPPKGVTDAYSITYTGNGRSTSVMSPGDAHSRELTGLIPGTRYDIDLVAVSSVGRSTAVTTSAVTDTDPPSTLEVSSWSATWMVLEWKAPLARVVSFEITVSDAFSEELYSVYEAKTSYNVTNLLPETEYVIKMVAVGDQGRSVEITCSKQTGPIPVPVPEQPITSTRAGTEASTSASVPWGDTSATSTSFGSTLKSTTTPRTTATSTIRRTTENEDKTTDRQTTTIYSMNTAEQLLDEIIYSTSPAQITEGPEEKLQHILQEISEDQLESGNPEEILSAINSINDVITTGAMSSPMSSSVMEDAAALIENLASASRGSQGTSTANMAAIANVLTETASAVMDMLPDQQPPIASSSNSLFESDLIDANSADFSPKQQLRMLKNKQKEREEMMLVFKKNPYSWKRSTGGQNISSPVTILSMDTRESGKGLKRKRRGGTRRGLNEVNLDIPFAPIQERLQTTNAPQVPTCKPRARNSEGSIDGINGTTMEYHRLSVPNGNVIPVLHMSWWDIDATFHVYILYGSKPTVERYGEKRVILQEDGLEAWLAETDFTFSFVPNTTQRGDVLYVGVQKIDRAGYSSEKQNRERAQDTPSYRLWMSAAACSSWEENNEQWGLEQCDAIVDMDKNVYHCKCHTTGSSIAVGTMTLPVPNSIDFINAFNNFSKVGENAVVFSIVVSEYILYIIIMVFLCADFSRLRGKRPENQWRPLSNVSLIPPDRMPAPHVYQLTVTTGAMFGAGTTSRVGFQLFGSDGTTPIKMLNPGGEVLLLLS
ncbi:uncharacterized protein LOC144922783 [Branchiostoma floridae x Branchiostoma belcheri]